VSAPASRELKNPPVLLRRVKDILKLLHITFFSPESKYENDGDVTFLTTLLKNIKAKVVIN